MAEFLQLIESINSEKASVSNLFKLSEDGQGVRSALRGPRYLELLSEAAALIAGVLDGRKPTYLLQEAMTTSDFPLLFGDILDRQVLANYAETAQTYRNYCKIGSVRDFRNVKRNYTEGAEGLLTTVAEQAPYPEVSLGEGQYTYAVNKYGQRIPFSWETMINDDLDQLKDIPQRFGRGARRTEEHFATSLFVDANGPHASFYTTNLITQANGAGSNNPVLSIAGIQDAMIMLSKARDSDGQPIVIDMYELVVPPALKVTAENILNATQLELGASTDAMRMQVANWMRNSLRLSVNAYIPYIASTANGNTSWFLFANPSNGRPALEMGFLRGHEQPEIFMKSPNAQRVGGGSVDPMNGDFDTDSLQYKIRHVLGGTRMDTKMTVASKGTGQA